MQPKSILAALAIIVFTGCSSETPIVNIDVQPAEPVIITNTETITLIDTVTVYVEDTGTIPQDTDDTADCVLVEWYADLDGDGFAGFVQTQFLCEGDPAGAGWLQTPPNDCLDGDPSSYPGAGERYDGVDNDCDGTVDAADSDYQTPELEMSFESWMGDVGFERGSSSVWIGNITFDPSEPMIVDQVPLVTFVNDDPGAIFGGFTELADDSIAFSDHFRDCVLKDLNGNIMAGPANPDADGLRFQDSFTVSTWTGTRVECNHTGAWPVGEYDGFAIDVDWDSSLIHAQALTGSPALTSTGNINGYAHPSTRAILQDSACTFDVEYRYGSIAQMHNELEIIFNGNPSYGPQTPGYLEMLEFSIREVHPGCSESTADGLTFWIDASDNAGTGWNNAIQLDLVDDLTGLVLYSLSAPANEPIPLSFAIEATSSLSVWVNANGANPSDILQVQILTDTLDWNDSAQSVTDAESNGIASYYSQF